MRRSLLIAGVAGLALLCALSFRRSYQPGPLLEAHESLAGNCAACHQPWKGVRNQSCIACHGDFTDMNPHGDVTLGDKSQGLLPGRKLTGFSDSLGCLSCHDEHRGRLVDIKVAAAFACADCHEHPSIAQVARHRKPMKRVAAVKHVMVKPFSHVGHGVLMSVDQLDCSTCHQLRPTSRGKEVRFDVKWSGCAGSDCHATPQEDPLNLPASLGKAPKLIGTLEPSWIRHINAVFTHSPAHLRYKCAECHTQIGLSKAQTDANGLAVKRCFDCHAHQPAANRTLAADWIFSGVAHAAPAPDKRVTACGDCHLFHSYGPRPTRDFPGQAPLRPPHQLLRLTFTAYTVSILHTAGSPLPTLTLRRTELTPWWGALLALALGGLSILGLLHYAPGAAGKTQMVEGVAPQRAARIPALDNTFQSNVAGLYIVGEAAGTASINLAMRSGREVVDLIASQIKHSDEKTEADVFDLAVVGCGPAGLGATATAKTHALNYLALEKLTAAGTIRTYPRGKFVQATPIDIAEYGSIFLEGDNTKEGLIGEWEKIIQSMRLSIKEHEEVISIKREGKRFELKTAAGNAFKARYVVLAIGVRGSPRRLGLAGETSDRVFYNLVEPEEFQNKKILVVGGGNAGAEVAQALSDPKLANTVHYSFREPALGRVTRENVDKVTALSEKKLLHLLPSSAIKEIMPGQVVLEPVKPAANSNKADTITLDNDVIFAMVGAEPPEKFLTSAGVRMTAKAS
jgi:thioredoxin reductase (NADPH)